MIKKRLVIKKNLFEVSFWVLIVYLLSGSPYTTINTEFSMVIDILAVIVLPYLLLVKRKCYKYSVLPLILLFIMIFLTMISHLEFQSRVYWRFLGTIIVAYYLLKKYGLNNIIELFLKIMVVISIASLIGYTLLNTSSVLNNLPTITNVNNVEYGIGFLFNYIKIYPERNCGVFWEPGIFASYLALAIVLESMTDTKKLNKFRIVLYIMSMITTTSSAGYVLLILSIGLILLRDSQLNGYKKLFAVCIILLICFLTLNIDKIILNTSLSNNKYLIKLTSERMKQSSRTTSIFHNLSIFYKFPLFGGGIDYVTSNMSSWADISTSTYILSIFGFLGLFYTIFIIWGIFSQKQINIFVKILFCFVLMSIVNKEPHINILFTWIIILGMASNRNAFHKNNVNYKNSSL